MLKRFLATLLGGLLLSASALAAIDLNSATQQQLEAINGIGPAKARAIIDYRSKSGPFKTVEDLMKVPGIKSATFARIKGEFTIGKPPAARPAAPARSTTTGSR